MLAINRSLITVKPTGNYIEWAMQVEPPALGEKESFLEEVNRTGNAYLIEDTDTPDVMEARALLARRWRAIADEEFQSWWTDKTEWPELNSLEDFERYFMWPHHEIVLDALSNKIEKKGS